MENSRKPSAKNAPGPLRPRFTVKDLGEILIVVLCSPLVWILPEKYWRAFSLPTALFFNCVGIVNTRKRILKIRKVRGEQFVDPKPWIIEIARATNVIDQKLQYLKECGPGGWKPAIDIRGIENVNDALKAGKGAILWIAPFFFNNLVVKKGFQEIGLSVSHLSAYNHGPSLSRFGMRFVNTRYIRAENKYLSERIVIQPARSLRYRNAGTNLNYIRMLEKKLKGNGLISVSCQPDTYLEHQGVPKKILNSNLALATGGPALALATGAALIPVFTVRRAPGSFDIIIENPVEIPVKGSRHDKVQGLLDSFSVLIEAYLSRYPTLFRSWRDLMFD